MVLIDASQSRKDSEGSRSSDIFFPMKDLRSYSKPSKTIRIGLQNQTLQKQRPQFREIFEISLSCVGNIPAPFVFMCIREAQNLAVWSETLRFTSIDESMPKQEILDTLQNWTIIEELKMLMSNTKFFFRSPDSTISTLVISAISFVKIKV